MPDHDPQREFAVEVVRRLKEAGYQALWAGGCVRDFLMGRDPDDYDIATDARPEDVRKLFGHRRTLAVGASFGVIIVRGPKRAGQVEVATFRTEGPYLDGRRPEHVEFSTPEADAARRDFTINGMFYDPVEQAVLDFVGGEKDLAARVVRAIGIPRDRMAEDKLRLLRAVRFTATLDFELDPATAEAVRSMAGELRVVSAERITQELKRMLTDPHRTRAVNLACELNVLQQIIPELEPLVRTSDVESTETEWGRTLEMLGLLQEPSFELAATVLLHTVSDAVSGICRRLRLSNQETDHIGWLVKRQDALNAAQTLPPARLKRLMARPLFADLLAFTRAKLLAANADLKPVLFCEEYLRHTPPEQINPPPLLTGDDLIGHGLQPGPYFKKLLETVRDAQLNGEIQTQHEAQALADRLVDEWRNTDV